MGNLLARTWTVATREKTIKVVSTGGWMGAARKGLRHANPGDVFGIENDKGVARFYKRGERGDVAYQITPRAAALEFMMRR